MIQPHWTKEQNPGYFSRTDTKYASVPLESIELLNNNAGFKELTESLPPGVIIAGGYITSILRGKEELSSDIDLYFESAEAMENLYKTIAANNRPKFFDGYSTNLDLKKIDDPDTAVVLFTANGKRPIQLIKIGWMDNPEAVIDGFDFTVCQFAVEGGQLYFNPLAFADLSSNTLNLHNIKYDEDLSGRLVKYIRKGFTPSDKCWLKFSKLLVKLNKNKKAEQDLVVNSNGQLEIVQAELLNSPLRTTPFRNPYRATTERALREIEARAYDAAPMVRINLEGVQGSATNLTYNNNTDFHQLIADVRDHINRTNNTNQPPTITFGSTQNVPASQVTYDSADIDLDTDIPF